MPGTAGGTVRCRAVTVARAMSSDVYFFLQSKPNEETAFVSLEMRRQGAPTSSNHVRLEKRSLQENVMFTECFVRGSQDFLGDSLARFQIVITFGQDLKQIGRHTLTSIDRLLQVQQWERCHSRRESENPFDDDRVRPRHSYLLTNRCVASQDVGCVTNAQLGWETVSDLQGTS